MNISQIINGTNPVTTPNENTVTVTDSINRESQKNTKKISNEKNISNEKIEKSISQANDIFKALGKNIQFIVNDDGTSNFRLKIVDSNTKETLKEFPDAYVVSVIEKINEMVGVLVDKKI